VTSASNESSLVLYGAFESGPLLLTGDAAVNALTWAAQSALGARASRTARHGAGAVARGLFAHPIRLARSASAASGRFGRAG
jgi:hypothetical protein